MLLVPKAHTGQLGWRPSAPFAPPTPAAAVAGAPASGGPEQPAVVAFLRLLPTAFFLFPKLCGTPTSSRAAMSRPSAADSGVLECGSDSPKTDPTSPMVDLESSCSARWSTPPVTGHRPVLSKADWPSHGRIRCSRGRIRSPLAGSHWDDSPRAAP
jgi:hypothetical protein